MFTTWEDVAFYELTFFHSLSLSAFNFYSMVSYFFLASSFFHRARYVFDELELDRKDENVFFEAPKCYFSLFAAAAAMNGM